MDNILAAIDFSDISAEVVARAEEVAAAFGAKLRLLHVAPSHPDFVGYEVGPETVRDGLAQELRQEHAQLQDIAKPLLERRINVTPLVVQGPTVETIIKEALKHEIDLIVIASHGHGAIYRAILGSVSEGVVHQSPCPVLVIPTRTIAEG